MTVVEQSVDQFSDGVKTALQFIVRGMDRLEETVDRFQQEAREDFASAGEVEVVKHAIHALRLDVDQRLKDMEKRFQGERVRDMQTVKWFLYVAIPAGGLAILKLIWDVFRVNVLPSGPATP